MASGAIWNCHLHFCIPRPAQRADRSPNRADVELLARWADTRRAVGLTRPAGPGWGNGWPCGPVAGCPCEVACRPWDLPHRLPVARHKPLGRTAGGIAAGRGFWVRMGRRPAQGASRSPSQGRRPWCRHPTTPSGPTGQPFHSTCGPGEELLARWAGTCRWGSFPARWGGLGGGGLGERLAFWAGWTRGPRRVRPLSMQSIPYAADRFQRARCGH